MRLTEHFASIGAPMYYFPKLKKITGSNTSAIFLVNLLSWTGHEKSQDGWIYKSVDDIDEETGLSYEEQKTARNRLKKLNFIEENYRRLDHLMYFRVNMEEVNDAWEAMLSRSKSDNLPIEALPCSGTGGFHDGPSSQCHVRTICTDNTSLSTDKKKKPALKEKHSEEIMRIVSKYNEVAKKRDWFLLTKIPMRGQIYDLLVKRSQDKDFMDGLETFCDKASRLDWVDAARIAWFLRRNTFDKVMSGEWTSRDSSSYENQHKPTDGKKLMPWDIVKPDPGRIVPQWEKANG